MMSTGAPTLERSTTGYLPISSNKEFVEIPVAPKPDDRGSIFTARTRLQEVVEQTLGISGPWIGLDEELDSGGDTSKEIIQNYEVVAEGIRVSSSEFDSRFGAVDLDALRGRMSAAKFHAYVRFMGIIPGGPTVDVIEISEIPS